ncbi:muscle M-line assembly protein unc-89-like [Dreissena polymorpha]|uniref:muscle M-line assembly protein unc-89-like n=1 Tax=Dreissena polymorpha TaxID=45954 RepID=UPI002263D361|nr:muscle M-line assembly protein unc-89-like [Dreissena polymorpha]
MDITSIAEGDRKCLVCQVVGMPRPSVYWLKDGVCISTNPRFRSEYREDGFVLLSIDKVSLKDAGTYSCIAINIMGSAETATFLRVEGTESKRLPLANATVTYTTFAENNSSPNETRQSDTHSDDQSIELEKKTNHIDVTDEAGNVIVELLHESLVEVHRGSLLELTWQIRGVHISKVHLIKNGERIQQKVGMSVHKADEIVFLRIASVSDVDEGDYTIQVENVTIEAAGKTSVRIVSTETENFPVNEEECNSAPRIEIKFSESSSVNLVKVNAAESFEDELNHASVDTDDELDLLAANALRRTALVRTRTLEQTTWGNSDTNSEECRQNNNTPSETLDTSETPLVAEDKGR